MRNNLVAELLQLANEDEKIYLLTGDLGYGVLNEFIEKFPDRVVNVGICEQNMMAIAAGMAMEGNTVYVYSIGNFPGVRSIEWVRNDVCYMNANVKIIVVGGGFAYGQLGMSHHATEDLAMMRALPNMNVFSPADPQEAVEVLRYANAIKTPCYIRLGKGKEELLHPALKQYDVRAVMELYQGVSVAVVATGSVLIEAKAAVDRLREEDIEVGLYNVITLKPIDREGVKNILSRYSYIITVEEHNTIGGLGTVIAEEMVCHWGKCRKLIKLGLQDVYSEVVGSQDYLRKYYGMSSEHIITKVKECLDLCDK